MPSQRQLRTLLVGVLIGVVFVLFYTSSLRANEVKDERTIQDFYHKTVNGLKHKQPPGQAVLEGNKPKAAGHVPVDKDADGDVDADDEKLAKDMQGRLKAAEDKAKELANKKSPLKPDAPSDVVGKGNSAAGQKKKEKTANGKEVSETEEEEKKKDESDEEHAVEVELNSILKKSPVIIFSKSYCPYSKKAKALLLEKYSIEPTPYVVELDKHPLGPQLQAFLGEKTGRKTVPNILVNSVSIGGGDDVIELDSQKKLVPRIIDLGQKKVEMKERSANSQKNN
ncbi:glutaredoxin [Colletotrichum paranaense]|uniref:Glutaredoxin n=5 Tax=Colletotrichum acutatum species complex TaxID=2707335 RepID=A0A9P9XAL1_9PEZI|nr:glutaredoxin [Colletotrichum costaricense]XP_060351017.1 glutaredoxin [Colletotrichum paranaense]XP_060381504.1 glutaredoxin [Colletotrichum tamarilloi]XP_060396373.1 glutaredoxin [Colletotrichum abscissum]KAK1449891.1 glutaredoxin [Colletotrichum melonis]KAI3544344.1 glutaredoxin [Colletotrichum abscissum]KAK1489904.1 glutaredoxin [Colletotrichum abscissum]KAK1497466.1 glutaredoxin [Colletotrichum tamarilloi]KAK1508167.1 glutaredoxin [Colletotrichum costaricense]